MRNLEFRHVCDCPCLGVSRATGAVEFVPSGTEPSADTPPKWESTIEDRVIKFKHWFTAAGGKVYTVKTDKSISIWGIFTDATMDLTIHPHDVLGNLDAYVYTKRSTGQYPSRDFYIHIKELDKQTELYHSKDTFYVKLPAMKEPFRSAASSSGSLVGNTGVDIKPPPKYLPSSQPRHNMPKIRRRSWLWW